MPVDRPGGTEIGRYFFGNFVCTTGKRQLAVGVDQTGNQRRLVTHVDDLHATRGLDRVPHFGDFAIDNQHVPRNQRVTVQRVDLAGFVQDGLGPTRTCG